MTTYLEFEKPISELESKVAELRHLPNNGEVDIADEVMRLQGRVDKLLRATYSKLTPWQRVQVARHPERPHAQRYIDRLITEFGRGQFIFKLDDGYFAASEKRTDGQAVGF